MNVDQRLDKIFSKVDKNADTIGFAAGFLAAPMAVGGGLGGVPQFVWDSIVNWRFPDKTTLDGIKAYLTSKGSPAYAPFVYGAGLGIAAMIAKEFEVEKIHPILANSVGVAEAIGWPMAVYTALSALLYVPSKVHESHPTLKELIYGTNETSDEVPDSVLDVVAQYAGCY